MHLNFPSSLLVLVLVTIIMLPKLLKRLRHTLTVTIAQWYHKVSPSFLLIIHLFLLTLSFSVQIPFSQSTRDSLNISTFLQGNLSSFRSIVSLVGATITPRLSDRVGRAPILVIGLVGAAIGTLFSYNFTSPTTYNGQEYLLFAALIPSALLQHNFSVGKAFITERSSDGGPLGIMGTAVGLAFMLGPILSAIGLITSYDDAVKFSLAMLVCSGSLLVPIFYKTSPPVNPATTTKAPKTSFFDIKPLKTKKGVYLIVTRFLMSLSFHIFMTIWTPSLKERFNFGPSDHGKFMSFIGLTYALSQSLTKPINKLFQGNTKILLVCSAVCLAGGRILAYLTTNLYVVYISFAFVICSLGVTNTVLTKLSGQIGDKSDLGGVIGGLQTVESVAGIVGPLYGGALYKFGGFGLPLAHVGVNYILVGIGALVFYERVFEETAAAKKKAE